MNASDSIPREGMTSARWSRARGFVTDSAWGWVSHFPDKGGKPDPGLPSGL